MVKKYLLMAADCYNLKRFLKWTREAIENAKKNCLASFLAVALTGAAGHKKPVAFGWK
ncbi:hypothetical protein [Flavisolibacter nicotianae]|uniref:hypothetical protein n=1 Tax=Flavisolibacter nicotianae TaxID=2364882 RepID=UPI0013C4AF9B|nr:hypothetical protein [Flavisolibacter nicotianae]